MAANPFFAPSPLPFGYPDFHAIREEHFLPAFTEGMARRRAEVDAITANPEPPTFANTIEALERSGDVLRRVSAIFFVLASSCSTEGIRAIEAEVAPLLAAHADAILLDPALFARIEAVATDEPTPRELTRPEAERLIERYHRDAVRAGARLDPGRQERLRAINAELSSLTTEFGNRLLAGATAAAVHVTDPAELRGLDGHLITLVLPTGQPALADLTDRDLRERLHHASITRGLGGPHDTRETLLAIVALRAERAQLLGHPHHASWVVDTATAGSTEAVDAMLKRLAPIAAANAREEADTLTTTAGYPIAPWDRAFFAERVRRERFAVDATALRPYLGL